MPANLAEAKGDQVVRPKLAHVAERHRRAGWVVGFYSITLVAAGASNDAVDGINKAIELAKI